jgi:hypothetical protein
MSETSLKYLPFVSAAGVVAVVAGTWAISPMWSDTESALNLSRVGLGAIGVLGGAPLAVWPWLVRAGMVVDPGRPWADQLERIAAEHGQSVQTDPELGVWFDTIHGGPRFRVWLEPLHRRMRLTGRHSARHGLYVVRRGQALPEDRAEWGRVTAGAEWSMHAEVQISAVSLSRNATLMTALDRFFEYPGATLVSFDPTGLSLHLELPHPERCESVVRRAMDAAWAVWGASNG